MVYKPSPSQSCCEHTRAAASPGLSAHPWHQGKAPFISAVSGSCGAALSGRCWCARAALLSRLLLLNWTLQPSPFRGCPWCWPPARGIARFAAGFAILVLILFLETVSSKLPGHIWQISKNCCWKFVQTWCYVRSKMGFYTWRGFHEITVFVIRKLMIPFAFSQMLSEFLTWCQICCDIVSIPFFLASRKCEKWKIWKSEREFFKEKFWCCYFLVYLFLEGQKNVKVA